MVKYISYIILALTVISCGKVDLAGFFVSPGDSVDKRFEQSKEYTQGLPYDMVETEEEYVIYICTDIHLDRTHINLDRFMSDFRNDEKSSFGLILGDIIDRKERWRNFIRLSGGIKQNSNTTDLFSSSPAIMTCSSDNGRILKDISVRLHIL